MYVDVQHYNRLSAVGVLVIVTIPNQPDNV